MSGITIGLLAAAAAIFGYLRFYGFQPTAGPIFEDRADALRLHFFHQLPKVDRLDYVDIFAAGAAFLDYDNDGDLDALLLQGGAPTDDSDPEGSGGIRLFRNDLDRPEHAEPFFSDVTSELGFRDAGYNLGVAVGDVDNDGWVDVYITRLGANQLWRNDAGKGFSEVAATAGVADGNLGISASFLDYDRDGHLDLFVVNNVDFRLTNRRQCFNSMGTPDYCGPMSYNPVSDRLYRNLGDGTFEDVTVRTGISALAASGLGVITADLNRDGWVDIYVANDAMLNHLWFNDGGKSFTEDALLSGSAVNHRGLPEASMGVDAGDIDADGYADLFMTHLLDETNTIYINDGNGRFMDRSAQAGLAQPSIGFTGFGTGFLDYDRDGWLDIIAVNGEVRAIPELKAEGSAWPYSQPNQLFKNESGRFRDVSKESPDLLIPFVSRGLAIGDVDNDGDPDVLVNNTLGPAQLLINRLDPPFSWLGVDIRLASGAPAIGAKVGLLRKGRPILWRRARSDGSYASANDPRVLFGLGETRSFDELIIHWPDGTEQRWSGQGLNRYHRIDRSKASASAPTSDD